MLLLVVVVLGAAGIAAEGSAIPQSVDHQLERALCIVRGGECQQDLAPCSVDTGRRETAASARILVFKVGGDKTIVRDERSDGTIAITVAYGKQTGFELAQGVHLAVSFGRGGIGLGGELTASAVASTEHGYTWIVRDPKAAGALVRRLGVSRRALESEVASGHLQVPALRYDQGGFLVSGGASRGRGTIELSSADVSGSRIDATTGRRTLYVQRTVDGALSLTGGPVGLTGSQRSRERYAITFDRSGRPVDLMVMTTGRYRVSMDLPARVQPAVGLLSAPTGRSRMYVEETHLDLTDPESLRVAEAFMDQVRHPRTVDAAAVAIAAALRHRLDAVGIVHARTYDADERRYGADGSIGVEGIRIGGQFSRTVEESHLVAATTRGIDGVWRKRTDCLALA